MKVLEILAAAVGAMCVFIVMFIADGVLLVAKLAIGLLVIGFVRRLLS